MKTSKPAIAATVFVSLAIASVYTTTAESESTAPEARSRFDNKTRRERLSHEGVIDAERGTAATDRRGTAEARRGPTEAPTGFDNLTNGFDPQGPPFEEINEDNVEPLRSFNDNRFIFEELEQIADGLGPTYNAQGCVECHQNVVTGSAAQITEQRTGRETDGGFFESLGGSLLHSRATHPDIVERVHPDDMVRTFRIATNTLGDGFVECIANSTLLEIRDNQPRRMRGTAVMVPVSGSQQTNHASAASAGRASTPAWYRSRPTPTSTKWA